MSNPLTEDWLPTAWRWSCPTCGRFIAAASVEEVDWRDNGAYYGVSTDIHAECKKCGRIEPDWRPTKFLLAIGAGDEF